MVPSLFVSVESMGILASSENFDMLPIVEIEGKKNAANHSWCSHMQILALSSVIGLDIKTIYPTPENLRDKVLSGVIKPRVSTYDIQQKSTITIVILYSRIGDLTFSKGFQPNHFVPLVEKIGDLLSCNNGKKVMVKQENEGI